jgi:muramoyltetrapeptide carboxypeptidase
MLMNSSELPIYCFAPSGKITDIESISRAKAFLETQGFELHNIECANRVYQRFAGSDQERLNEINDLPEITSSIGPNIALAIRGGYGVSRLLPKIQWDRLAKAVDDGLVIVGHSDLSSLQIGLFAKTGRVSHAGPMLSYDFGRNPAELSQFTLHHFLEAVLRQRVDVKVQHHQQWLDASQADYEGTLWGGNLSILASLLNTSHFPSKSLIKNGILFIEDVNEHPYRVERMLLQLLQAGVLETQQAILFGDFSGYQLSPHDDGYDLNACISVIKSQLKELGAKTQLLNNLPFGHCHDKLTLPVGGKCQISANKEGFRLKSI